MALKIWNAVMTKAHEGLDAKPFFEAEPPNIVKRKICLDSGKIATDLCSADPRGSRVREEYFIEGTEPSYSDTCTVHISARVDTSMKDVYGRYLLANEYCPPDVVKEISAIRRPVEWTPVFPNDKPPADIIYEIAEGEYCTKHGPTKALVPPVSQNVPYEPVPESGEIGDALQDWNIDWGASDDPNTWN